MQARAHRDVYVADETTRAMVSGHAQGNGHAVDVPINP
jgi:hypothetical protein